MSGRYVSQISSSCSSSSSAAAAALSTTRTTRIAIFTSKTKVKKCVSKAAAANDCKARKKKAKKPLLQNPNSRDGKCLTQNFEDEICRRRDQQGNDGGRPQTTDEGEGSRQRRSKFGHPYILYRSMA